MMESPAPNQNPQTPTPQTPPTQPAQTPPIQNSQTPPAGNIQLPPQPAPIDSPKMGKPKVNLGKIFASIIILILLGISAASGYTIYKNLQNNDQTACTLEAKICPDGTSVGREGPNCEFAPCSTPSSLSENNIELQMLEGLIDYEVPEEWNKEVQTNSFGAIILITSKDYEPDISNIILNSGAKITISKIFYDNPMTIAELVNSYRETAGTQEVSVKKIDGKDAVYVLSNYEGFYESYYIPYGKEWLDITFQYPGNTYEEAMTARNAYLQDIDTFLKSLKFSL